MKVKWPCLLDPTLLLFMKSGHVKLLMSESIGVWQLLVSVHAYPYGFEPHLQDSKLQNHQLMTASFIARPR